MLDIFLSVFFLKILCTVKQLFMNDKFFFKTKFTSWLRIGKTVIRILLWFVSYVTFQIIKKKTETNFLFCIFMLFSNIKPTYFKSSEKLEPSENIIFQKDEWCFREKCSMIFTKEYFPCFSLLCLLNRFILCKNFKCNFQGSHLKQSSIDQLCLSNE